MKIGKSQQQKINNEIRAMIATQGNDPAQYSEEDKLLLSQYEGMGGVEEGRGMLDQFYTPPFIVQKMYDLAYKYGFTQNGKVLEPAAGTCRFIAAAPIQEYVTAFEPDEINSTICRILYPEAKIYNMYFEQAFLEAPRMTRRLPEKELTWLTDYPFDLVIGNPPYGKHTNMYQPFFKSPRFKSLEMFFMYWPLKLLKPGGLLIYITASNFLRNGQTYREEKEKIFDLAKLIDAYRMPNGIFSHTQVGTDIIVLQRK